MLACNSGAAPAPMRAVSNEGGGASAKTFRQTRPAQVKSIRRRLTQGIRSKQPGSQAAWQHGRQKCLVLFYMKSLSLTGLPLWIIDHIASHVLRRRERRVAAYAFRPSRGEAPARRRQPLYTIHHTRRRNMPAASQAGVFILPFVKGRLSRSLKLPLHQASGSRYKGTLG